MPEPFNFIKVYVILTFLFVLIYGNKNGKINILLFLVIAAGFINESLAAILILYHGSIALITNIYVLVSTILWLLILKKAADTKLPFGWAISGYLALCGYFAYMSGLQVFNYYVFVGGGLIYVLLFMLDSIKQLQNENFDYFLSSHYIALIAPVFFFLGFSLLFGFHSTELGEIRIGGIQLFTYISYFVNIVYYSILNYYFIRQKRTACIAK